jgi:hypothetical protein
MKTIIEKYEEIFNNIPEKWTNKSDVKDFIQSELKALRDEVVGEEKKERSQLPLGGVIKRFAEEKDIEGLLYAFSHILTDEKNAHRQHCIDVFEKFGIK